HTLLRRYSETYTGSMPVHLSPRLSSSHNEYWPSAVDSKLIHAHLVASGKWTPMVKCVRPRGAHLSVPVSQKSGSRSSPWPGRWSPWGGPIRTICRMFMLYVVRIDDDRSYRTSNARMTSEHNRHTMRQGPVLIGPTPR